MSALLAASQEAVRAQMRSATSDLARSLPPPFHVATTVHDTGRRSPRAPPLFCPRRSSGGRASIPHKRYWPPRPLGARLRPTSLLGITRRDQSRSCGDSWLRLASPSSASRRETRRPCTARSKLPQPNSTRCATLLPSVSRRICQQTAEQMARSKCPAQSPTSRVED